ncbi:MAG: hypothetical protein AAF191_08750, partial [Verrucomicrobiota bacterium]
MFAIYEGEREFIIEHEGQQYQSYPFSFNELFQAEDPYARLVELLDGRNPLRVPKELVQTYWYAPIESQEVW